MPTPLRGNVAARFKDPTSGEEQVGFLSGIANQFGEYGFTTDLSQAQIITGSQCLGLDNPITFTSSVRPHYRVVISILTLAPF